MSFGVPTLARSLTVVRMHSLGHLYLSIELDPECGCRCGIRSTARYHYDNPKLYDEPAGQVPGCRVAHRGARGEWLYCGTQNIW